MEPKKRSKLRITLRTIYYTSKRYFQWYVIRKGKKYALTLERDCFPNKVFSYQVPLLKTRRQGDVSFVLLRMKTRGRFVCLANEDKGTFRLSC